MLKITILISAILLIGLAFLANKKLRHMFDKKELQKTNQQKKDIAKLIMAKLSMLCAINNNKDQLSEIQNLRTNLYNQSIFSENEIAKIISLKADQKAENTISKSLVNEVSALQKLL